MPVCELTGPDDDRVFVLVHALPGDARQLRPLAQVLAATRRVALVELPDCGSASDEISVEPEEAVEHLRGVVAGLAPKEVTLVGYSFGAWAGARLAGRGAPTNLRQLVLVSSFPQLTPAHESGYFELAGALEGGGMSGEQFAETAAAILFPGGCSSETRAHLHELYAKVPVERLARQLRRAGACASARCRVEGYGVPAILLHAERDPGVPLALARELAALGRDTRLETVDTDSHYLPWSHLAECAAFVV